ncbi:MAG: hypothetical protein J0H04_07940 [Hyphomicrobium denitrificans]|nr:hypothetical protein [Hyphomicrobium denitrificans]
MLDPFVPRILPSLPLPRRRVFYEPLPIENNFARIEPIVENAVRTLSASVYR